MKINDNIEIYNEDCMELMKRYPDKYFDLAIVDPPYGINMDGGKIGGDNAGKAKEYTQKDWDKSAPDIEYFKELIRISKKQIIWGANHFISKIPFDSSCWIVWDKNNSGNFADCELAWTSFDTAVRKFKWTWNGMLQEKMKNKQERIHPTEKPIELYEFLLKNYAKNGFKIIDTHGGSLSIAVALDRCNKIDNMNLSLVASELDKDYFDQSVLRVKNEIKQQSLFTL